MPSAHVQAFQLSLVCCFVVCCFAAMSSGKFPLRGVAIVVPSPRCFCCHLMLGDKSVCCYTAAILHIANFVMHSVVLLSSGATGGGKRARAFTMCRQSEGFAGLPAAIVFFVAANLSVFCCCIKRSVSARAFFTVDKWRGPRQNLSTRKKLCAATERTCRRA